MGFVIRWSGRDWRGFRGYRGVLTAKPTAKVKLGDEERDRHSIDPSKGFQLDDVDSTLTRLAFRDEGLGFAEALRRLCLG